MPSLYSVQSILDLLEDIPDVFKGTPENILEGAGETVRRRIVEENDSRKSLTEGRQSALGDGRDIEEPSSDTPIFHIADQASERAITDLAAAARDQYRSQVLLRGIDALGYYVTFHQTIYKWGIYLPVSGIAWVCQEVFGSLPLDINTKVRLSASLILAHERFHFAADFATAQMELAHGRALYWPARHAKRSDLSLKEEEVANGFMLRRFRTSPEVRKARGAYRAAVAFSKTQPPGYREGFKLVASRTTFEHEVLNHAQAVLDYALAREPQYGVEWHRVYPIDSVLDLQQCPVHVISDEHVFGLHDIGLRLIRSVDAVGESSRFQKQLAKLGSDLAKRWRRAREKMAVSVQCAGLDFKPWPPGGANCYSIRVSANHRAHLLREGEHNWLADAIGTHKEMGHG